MGPAHNHYGKCGDGARSRGVGDQMMGVGPPELLVVALGLLSWALGLILSIRRLLEKDSTPRRFYLFLAVVAGPLGIFVAAAVWLTFPPEASVRAPESESA